MGKDFKLTSAPIVDYKYQVPYTELLTALDYKQGKYDENINAIDELEEKWLSLSAVPGEGEKAKAIQQKYDKMAEQIATSVGGDYSQADSLIRSVSRTMKKDLLTGEMGRINNAYQAYQAHKEALDKRVNATEKDQRIERSIANQALQYSLANYLNAGGSSTEGNSYSGYAPVPYVDLAAQTDKFLKEWKPDTFIGDIVKRDDGKYYKKVFETDDSGQMYWANKYEVANAGDIQRAAMDHLMSDPMAMQYVNEGVMFDMAGITDDYLASQDGQSLVAETRQDLIDAGYPANSTASQTGVTQMSDTDVIEEALRLNLLQGVVTPYAEKYGYTKELGDPTLFPEWMMFGGRSREEIKSRVDVYQNTTPAIQFGVDYDSVADLQGAISGLDTQIASVDALINADEEVFAANPNDMGAWNRISANMAKKAILQRHKEMLEQNFDIKPEEIAALEDQYYDIENTAAFRLGNINGEERKAIVDEWESTYIGEGAGKFKDHNDFISQLHQAMLNSGEYKTRSLTPDQQINEIRAGLWALSEAPSDIAQLTMTVAGAPLSGTIDEDIEAGLRTMGLWNDNNSKADNFSIFANYSRMIQDKERFVAENSEYTLDGKQTQAAMVFPTTEYHLKQGEEGQSLISRKLSDAYTTNRESFVVFDMSDRKQGTVSEMVYSENPGQIVFTGITTDAVGDYGHMFTGYVPVVEDGKVVTDNNGVPLNSGQQLLIAPNQFSGSGNRLYTMLADDLANSGLTDGIEQARRLRAQGITTQLNKFQHLADPTGDMKQTVDVNIAPDNYLRFNRQNINGRVLYKFEHYKAGQLIAAPETTFESLEQARAIAMTTFESTYGTDQQVNNESSGSSNLDLSWVGSVGDGGLFTDTDALNTYKAQAKTIASSMGIAINPGTSLGMKVDAQAYSPYISNGFLSVIEASGLGDRLENEVLVSGFRTEEYNRALQNVGNEAATGSRHTKGEAIDVRYTRAFEQYLDENKQSLREQGIRYLVHGEGSDKHIHIQLA